MSRQGPGGGRCERAKEQPQVAVALGKRADRAWSGPSRGRIRFPPWLWVAIFVGLLVWNASLFFSPMSGPVVDRPLLHVPRPGPSQQRRRRDDLRPGRDRDVQDGDPISVAGPIQLPGAPVGGRRASGAASPPSRT